MPLLLAYLKSVRPEHTQHLAKACYALENFVENLGNGGSRERREGFSRRGRIFACRVAVEEPSGVVGTQKGDPGEVVANRPFPQGLKCSPTFRSLWSVCCSL